MREIKVLLLSLLVFVSCSKIDTSPEAISIAHLKLMYGGYPRSITENIVISGQVVADNSINNLRGCVIIEDATGAIEIQVPDSYVADYIHIGNIVNVRCQGLCLGGYGGVVELGLESENIDYQTSNITSDVFRLYIDILEDGYSDDIVASEIEISDLSSEMISTMVTLKNLTVIASDSQNAWCSTVDENVNTLAVDSQGDTITLRVYGYCDFATDLLPSRAIDIEGSVGYFSGYQIRLLDYEFSEN